MYAIIETGGKQYKVSEGDIITVEKLAVEAGSEYKFDKVLVLAKEGDIAAQMYEDFMKAQRLLQK